MVALLITCLSFLAGALAAAPSPLSCLAIINVTGAGDDDVNGMYFEDTEALSDNVPYFYKWSDKLNDYYLLYREQDEVTKVPFWAIQTFANFEAVSWMHYFIDAPHGTTWDRPPATGWVGNGTASQSAIGAEPTPSFAVVHSGNMWDEEFQSCVRDCSKLKASMKAPNRTCATATVKGAGSAHVNLVFFQTEYTSDCVPYYMAANVTPPLVMFRDSYDTQTYWTLMDTTQEAAEEFQEWYGVVSSSPDPPANGWFVERGYSVGKPGNPNVAFSGTCSAEQLAQQRQLLSSTEAATTAAAIKSVTKPTPTASAVDMGATKLQVVTLISVIAGILQL